MALQVDVMRDGGQGWRRGPGRTREGHRSARPAAALVQLLVVVGLALVSRWRRRLCTVLWWRAIPTGAL